MTAKRGAKEKEVRVADGDGLNRTGMALSVHADEMRETAAQFRPQGTEREFRAFRQKGREGAGTLGSPPPPASLKGAVREAARQLAGRETTLLLDKLGERLAFERTGTRLYETLLEKVAADGFEGGPSRADLEHIRDEEAAHFHMLHAKLVELDGDPTAVTPSADLAAVTSMGVVAVVSDARTSLAESLEAILVAELADRDGWARLVELAEESGQDELARAGREAERVEEEHLAKVRGWLSAYARAAADGGDD
jgi:rubrerythrin